MIVQILVLRAHLKINNKIIKNLSHNLWRKFCKGTFKYSSWRFTQSFRARCLDVSPLLFDVHLVQQILTEGQRKKCDLQTIFMKHRCSDYSVLTSASQFWWVKNDEPKLFTKTLIFQENVTGYIIYICQKWSAFIVSW